MRRMLASAGAAFIVAAGLIYAAPASAASAPAKAPGIHTQSGATDVSARRRRYRGYRRYRYYRPYYGPSYYPYQPYYYRPYYYRRPGIYFGGPGFGFGFGF